MRLSTSSSVSDCSRMSSHLTHAALVCADHTSAVAAVAGEIKQEVVKVGGAVQQLGGAVQQLAQDEKARHQEVLSQFAANGAKLDGLKKDISQGLQGVVSAVQSAQNKLSKELAGL